MSESVVGRVSGSEVPKLRSTCNSNASAECGRLRENPTNPKPQTNSNVEGRTVGKRKLCYVLFQVLLARLLAAALAERMGVSLLRRAPLRMSGG